ncbi:hypothetical protein ACHQM5_017491 [Ranunculus cassubicifolius]
MVSFLLRNRFQCKSSCRFSITITKKRRKTRTRRNWLDLPRDIMILIFSKLDTTEILCHAQFVCSSWLRFAQEHTLFRYISVPDVPLNYPVDDIAKILKEAVDRSCGELVKIYLGEPWCNDKLLHYIVQKSNSLKSLRLSRLGDVTKDGLIEACKRLPHLEEFEVRDCNCYWALEVIKELGISCSQLKRMGFYFSCGPPCQIECEEVELAIAQNLPRLQSLCLSRMWVTNKGFQAILDQCSLLDHIDFCLCLSNDIKEDLKERSVDKFRDGQFPCMIRGIVGGRSCLSALVLIVPIG